MLTESSGHLNSEDSLLNSRESKCTWLISVKQNHSIWLTFTEKAVGKCLKMEVNNLSTDYNDN